MILSNIVNLRSDWDTRESLKKPPAPTTTKKQTPDKWNLSQICMSLFVLISSLEIKLKAPILPGNVSKRFGPLENTIIYISCHLQIAAVVQFWKLQTLSWNPSSSGYWPVQLQQYPFSLGLGFFLTVNEDATYFAGCSKDEKKQPKLYKADLGSSPDSASCYTLQSSASFPPKLCPILTVPCKQAALLLCLSCGKGLIIVPTSSSAAVRMESISTCSAH